jgi:hypothetical protein|tara:strand:- start:584 stop:1048 length:465 start_codon:yes stop_codon:yes gene_type:complete
MKLRFLCVNHAQELKVNTSKALKSCQDGFDTGRFYNDSSQWKEAIPHLGCAFETADILLSHSTIDDEVSCDWLAASAQLLAVNLSNLQYVSQAEDIIQMAITRLEKQLHHYPSNAPWMDNYLAPLYSQLKSYVVKPVKSHYVGGNNLDSMGLLH